MAEPLSIQVTLAAIDRMTAPVRAALGANKALADSLQQTRERLKQLDQAQQALTAYHKLKEQSTKLGAEMDAAKAKAKALALELKNPQPSEALQKRLAKAGQSAYQLGSDLRLAQLKLEQLQQKMQATEQPSAKLKAQFEQAQNKVSQLSEKFDQTKTKLALLSAKMEEASKPSAKLKAEFEKARAEVNRLQEAQQQLTRRMDQTRQKVTEAGVPMRSLTEAQRHLRRETDSASQALERQANSLNHVMQQQARAAQHARQQQQLRNNLQNNLQMQQDVASVAYPALAAGTGLVYAATQPVMQSANLTDQVNDIAITGSMSANDEAALRERVRKVAIDTNQEQSEIGKGVQILVANGMNAKDAGSYAGLLGKTATASRARMEDISNVTFSLQNSLKIQGVDAMNEAMNNLVHAGKQGQFELRDMARYFPSLSAQMASMGATGQDAVKELAIGMQAARKTAGTSQEAAANMANWFSHMTASSTLEHFDQAGIDYKAEVMKRMQDKDPAKRMSALRASVDVFDQYVDKLTAGKTITIRSASGKVKDTLNFKQALERAKASGNEDEVRSIVERFGLSKIIQDMQTANFYLAMRQNKDFIDQGMASFDAAGVQQTIDNDVKRRLESPIEQFKAAKIAWQDTLTQVGDTILPVITPWVQQLTQATQKVTAWAQANPELVATLLKVVGVLGLVLIGFGGLTMMILSIVGPIAMLRFGIGSLVLNLRWLWSIGAAGVGVLGRLGPVFSILRSGAMLAGNALLWLGRAALLNPIGLLITTLAVAAYLLYRNWSTLKAWWDKSELKKHVMPIVTSTLDYAKTKWVQLKHWWNNSSLAEKALGLGTAHLQIARVLATDFFNWWKTTELGQKSIKIGTEMVDWARNKVTEFVNWFNSLSLKTLVASASSYTPPMVRSTFQAGHTAGQWIKDKLGFGGGRASGGSVSSGHFYQVNELGPELLQMAGKNYLMMGGSTGKVIPLAANQSSLTRATEKQGKVLPWIKDKLDFGGHGTPHNKLSSALHMLIMGGSTGKVIPLAANQSSLTRATENQGKVLPWIKDKLDFGGHGTPHNKLSSALHMLMMGGSTGKVIPLAANQANFTQAPEKQGKVLPLQRRSVQHQTTTKQTITITINASPGMNEQAVANVVVSKLREQHNRQRYARAGVMYDGDYL